MQKVMEISKNRKPVTHYAYLGDTYGTAALLSGSGWLFRKDGERQAVVVDYRNPHLMLLGRCDLVAEADAADGDRVVRCSRTLVEVA